MKQNYYKIVTWNRLSILASAYSSTLRYSIEYKENEWVTPKNLDSKLFVFDDLANARQWIRTFGMSLCHQYKIYEVEVRNPFKPRIMQWRFTSQRFDSFWTHIKQKKVHKSVCVGRPAEGTIWCDAVRLIRQVNSIEAGK